MAVRQRGCAARRCIGRGDAPCAPHLGLIAILAICLPHFTSAQQVNVQIPGLSNLYGSNKKVTERWWFWLIIGFIAAFTVVLTYFTWRGCRRYRAQAKNQREREAAVAAAGGGPIELAAHPRVVASKADGVDLEHGVKPEDIDGYKDGLPVWKLDAWEVERRTGVRRPRGGPQLLELPTRAGPAPAVVVVPAADPAP